MAGDVIGSYPAGLSAISIPRWAVAKREIVTHSSEETIQRGREIGAALEAHPR